MKAPKKQVPTSKGTSFQLPPLLWQGGIAMVMIILAYFAFQMNSDDIKDYRHASDAQLKSLFLGDHPQVIYCHRGGKNEEIPPLLSQYKSTKKDKVGIAMVNCSYVLPSGRNVWDRFKIKREWKPTIFAMAPWTKPKQLSPVHLKDFSSMKKYLDGALQPKGTEVTSEKDLSKFCGFYSAKSSMETCLVIMRGARYAKTHADIEEKFVRTNPRQKIATVDGTKLRFSFENVNDFPADAFAIRLHAIRNGTHYQTMTFPSTFDYMQSFTVETLGAPIESYSGPGKVGLVKVSSSSFKDRSAKAPPPTSSSSSEDSKPSKQSRKERRDSYRDSKKDSSKDEPRRARSHENEREGIHEESYTGSSGAEDEDEVEVIEL